MLGLGLLAGCATAGAGRPAEAGLFAPLEAARCERTLDESWDAARRLLAARGYPLAAADARAVGVATDFLQSSGGLVARLSRARQTAEADGRRTLETGWSKGRRYRLEGAAAAPGCHVIFLAIAEDPGQPNVDLWAAPVRDAGLERALLEALAPGAAAGLGP